MELRGRGTFLGKNVSVYQAEALAIKDACEIVHRTLNQGADITAVTLYSDSQSVLRALSSRWVRSKVIFDCCLALNDLGRRVPIHLRWVRGHSGVPGNDRADALAREAALRGGPPLLQVPRSSAYFREAFKRFLYDQWQLRSSSMDPSFARQTRIWFPRPSPRRSRKLLAQPRAEFSRAVRGLSGHAYLGLQNFRCGTHAVSVCRLCGQVPERPDHLLLECPCLQSMRASTLRLLAPSPAPVWEVEWILKFLAHPSVLQLEDPLALGEGDDNNDG